MSKINKRIFDIFRNLKSDAVPKAPRPSNEDINNPDSEANVDNSDEFEEKSFKKEKKHKKPNSPPKSEFDSQGPTNTSKEDQENGNNVVNTQATGNVINIVNSKGIHCGNINYIGTKSKNQKHEEEKDNEVIEKNNSIILLMECGEAPGHLYIDYISKNLGRNWHSFFRCLGYSKGRIETVEIDEARNGVSEARYKLLLDWKRNSDDATLGQLSTLLWDHGERSIVKELAVLYNTEKN